MKMSKYSNLMQKIGNKNLVGATAISKKLSVRVLFIIINKSKWPLELTIFYNHHILEN